LFIMEGAGEVTIYNGNYSEYRISLDTAKEKPDTRKKESPVQAEVSQKKLTYKEQKELEELEVLIPETEEEIKNLTLSLLKIESSNYLEIQSVTKEIDTLKEQLDQATVRWLELSEK